MLFKELRLPYIQKKYWEELQILKLPVWKNSGGYAKIIQEQTKELKRSLELKNKRSL